MVTERDPDADMLAPWESEIMMLTAQRDWYRYALSTIGGPADSGPLMAAYRAAGGGYEGLQAIARTALEREPGDDDFAFVRQLDVLRRASGLPDHWESFNTDDMCDLADAIGVDYRHLLDVDDLNANEVRRLIRDHLDEGRH